METTALTWEHDTGYAVARYGDYVLTAEDRPLIAEEGTQTVWFIETQVNIWHRNLVDQGESNSIAEAIELMEDRILN